MGPAMIRHVDENALWRIIEQTRQKAAGDIARQPGELRKLLSKRRPAEVAAFGRRMSAVLDQAHTNDLGHAAGLLLGGVGDDSFQDFRVWLLCHGRATFQRALTDPDSIADVPFDEGEEDFGAAERFGYVAADVYEELTGDEPPDDFDLDAADIDDSWYDDATLRRRFPRLYERAESLHPAYLRERFKSR